MANIKSQIKRNKQSEVARQRNKKSKSALKTYINKFEETIAGKDKKAAKDALTQAVSRLDKAASKGLIHHNNAAVKKSRLTKKFNAL
ncbi:MAG TPA: 30S ribosomal protein S20 [Actinobacteria bacterium]|nr:30S ribosomal protein S20 [Actinomycetes bacterium]HEX21465.1 30S ribosomal protein S20 [Actinomycetota bacterium]